MRITRQARLFDYTDKVLKAYLLQMVRKINKMLRKVSVTPFDEINIMGAVNSEWSEIEKLMQEALQKIALYYYHAGCDYCGKEREDELFILYFLEYLDGYNEITHYQYHNELDRKRARLIEAILSVKTFTDRRKQLELARKLLAKQFKQTADDVTDMALLKAYEEAGVMEVEWVTMDDEKVCAECEALDGQTFPLEDCPPLPQHYNCRCFVIPVLI